MISEAVLISYLALSLAIGFIFKSKADTIKGFLVANREIGEWLLAFTFGATYFSSVVIVVGGAWAFLWGSTSMLIPLMNVLAGALLTFILIGREINKLSAQYDALTVPELFAKVYNNGNLQKLLGLVTAIGLTLYAATVISGAAAMVGTVFGIDLATSAFLIALVMAIYVALGGMYSVVWTDAIQGIIMALGVLSLAALASLRAGGLGALEASKPYVPPQKIDVALIVDLAFLTSIAVWGLPQLLNRFYTAKSPSVVKRSTFIATAFAFIVTYGSFISGLAASHLVQGKVNPLKVIPILAKEMLGPIGASVFSAAVLAAAMSTADSISLTVGSAVAYDILGIRDTKVLRVLSFLSMVIAAGIAVLTLTLPKELASAVTSVFKTGWTLTAGAFLVPVLAVVFKVGRTESVVASSLVGALVALLYGFAKALSFKLPFMDMSFCVTILASALAFVVMEVIRRNG
ncbi:hypothetical protein EYM_02650 [Ignicoccus islandicus DSM 13165]|uniref:Sodium:solute symporter n=1 Tax=Ignicoccus islandicus DSM 13165 TaxID=940295 RepID=A0A0U3FR02_9CREN|nr:hypothetical protein [Ignicoccus islandicus]ALU12343.1 hypothetical protein EYM_02650 [Ignicoccus islandicus DSM 13165]